MSVKINVRETENAVILEVIGRITLGASGPSLQARVRELLDSGHKNIILDLGGVTFLDSSGLGQLVGSYATAVSRGSEIRLLNLNKRVYDPMQSRSNGGQEFRSGGCISVEGGVALRTLLAPWLQLPRR